MSEEKTREQRIAEFEARKKQRLEDERKMRELVEDLEMKYDEELGPRGKEWEMIETEDGPIVVILGTLSAFKKFSESKKTQIDVENFVRPLVKYPDGKAYAELVDKRPVYAVRLANALGTLYGMKDEARGGKY